MATPFIPPTIPVEDDDESAVAPSRYNFTPPTIATEDTGSDLPDSVIDPAASALVEQQYRTNTRNYLGNRLRREQRIQAGQEPGYDVDNSLGVGNSILLGGEKAFIGGAKSLLLGVQSFRRAESKLPSSLSPKIPGLDKLVDNFLDHASKAYDIAEKEKEEELKGAGQLGSEQLASKASGAVVGTVPIVLSGYAGGLPAMAIFGGLQTAGSVYDAATEHYKAQGLDEEAAKDKALFPALSSGIANAALVGLMKPLGAKTAGAFRSMLGIPAADVVPELLPKTLTDVITNSAKEIAGGVKFAIADRAVQDAIAKISYRPELTFGDFVKETVGAAIEMGAVSAFFAPFNQGSAYLGNVRNRANRLQDLTEQRKFTQKARAARDKLTGQWEQKLAEFDEPAAPPEAPPVTEVPVPVTEVTPAPTAVERVTPKVVIEPSKVLDRLSEEAGGGEGGRVFALNSEYTAEAMAKIMGGRKAVIALERAGVLEKAPSGYKLNLATYQAEIESLQRRGFLPNPEPPLPAPVKPEAEVIPPDSGQTATPARVNLTEAIDWVTPTNEKVKAGKGKKSAMPYEETDSRERLLADASATRRKTKKVGIFQNDETGQVLVSSVWSNNGPKVGLPAELNNGKAGGASLSTLMPLEGSQWRQIGTLKTKDWHNTTDADRIAQLYSAEEWAPIQAELRNKAGTVAPPPVTERPGTAEELISTGQRIASAGTAGVRTPTPYNEPGAKLISPQAAKQVAKLMPNEKPTRDELVDALIADSGKHSQKTHKGKTETPSLLDTMVNAFLPEGGNRQLAILELINHLHESFELSTSTADALKRIQTKPAEQRRGVGEEDRGSIGQEELATRTETAEAEHDQQGYDAFAEGQKPPNGWENVGTETGDKAFTKVIEDASGNIDVILKQIEDSSLTPFYRELAKKLQKLGLKAKVLSTPSEKMQALLDGIKDKPENPAGFWAGDLGEMWVNPIHQSHIQERALLHEAIHAATMESYNQDAAFRKKVDALLKEARAELGGEDYYGLRNGKEFLSESFTRPEFREALSKIQPERGVLGTVWDRLVDLVRSVLGLSPKQRDLLSRALKVGEEGFSAKRGDEGAFSIEKAVERRKAFNEHPTGPEKDIVTMQEMLNESAADVLTSSLATRAAIKRLEAIAAAPVPTGLTREQRSRAMTEANAAAETLKTVSDLLVQPVKAFQEASKEAGRALDDFISAMRDPARTEQEKSTITLHAYERIKQVDNAIAKFNVEYGFKEKALKTELEQLLEAKAEAKSELGDYKAVKENFIDALNAARRMETSGVGVSVLADLIRKSEAATRVMHYIAKHLPLLADVKNPADIIKTVAAHIGGDYSKLGASQEVLELTAQAMTKSATLAEVIKGAHEYIVKPPTKAEMNEFLVPLRDAIKRGDYESALSLFTDGVGKNVKLSDRAKNAMNFFAAKARRRAVQLRSMAMTKDLYDSILKDPGYQKIADLVYDRLGVRSVIHTQPERENSILFRKLPGMTEIGPDGKERPMQDMLISHDYDPAKAEENWQKQTEYRAKAVAYIADRDNPQYDRALAAGLRHFLKYDEPFYFMDTMLAGSKRAKQGFLRTLPDRVGLTKFMATAQSTLQHIIGAAGHSAARASNAHDAARQANITTWYLYHPEYAIAVKNALKSHPEHDGEMQPTVWQEKVMRPVLASNQYHENTGKLNVGDKIANGYTVTKEDMVAIKKYLAWITDLMDRASGDHSSAASALLEQDLGRVIEKGRTGLTTRKQAHTGPMTAPRGWGTIREVWRQWKGAETPAAKIALINKSPDILLLGYMMGTHETSLGFKYQFGEILKEVLKDAADRIDPVNSFSDLTDRVFDRLTGEVDYPFTTSEVAKVLLDEFDMFAKRIGKNTEEGAPKMEAGITYSDNYGGRNAFNTARGEQMVPSLWYDYGAATDGQLLNQMAASTKPFLIRHLVALDALKRAIDRKLDDLRDDLDAGRTTKGKLAKDVKERKEFYDFGELKRMRIAVTHELNNLKGVMDYEDRVPLEATGAAEAWRTIGQAAATGVLTNVGPSIRNYMGGLTLQTLHDIQMGVPVKESFTRNLKQGVKGAMAAVIHAAGSRGPVADFLGNKHGKRWMGDFAETLAEYIKDYSDSLEIARNLGISNNVQLFNTLRSYKEWIGTGGRMEDLVDPNTAKKIGKGTLASIRSLQAVMGQVGVGKVDETINVNAISAADQKVKELSEMAMLYAEPRVLAARADGREMFHEVDGPNGKELNVNLSNQADHFSEAELVNGRKTSRNELAGIKLRQFLQRNAGINIDQAALLYWKRMTDAQAREQAEGAPEGSYTKDVKFLTDAQRNSLITAYADLNNHANFGNRPKFWKTGDLQGFLGLFKAFPSNLYFRLTEMGDRLQTESWAKGHRAHVATLLATAASVAFYALLGDTGDDAYQRYVTNIYRRNPGLLDIDKGMEHPVRYGMALANVVAGAVPLLGYIFNNVTQGSYRNGFDINSQFFHLNLLTDIADKIRKAIMTQSLAEPMIDLAERWVPGLRVLTQFLPNRSGMREFRNSGNLAIKGAWLTGNMDNLRKGGVGGTVYYGPATPILNRMRNAVGNGDDAEFQKGYQELVELRRAAGSATPEDDAKRAAATLNPVAQVFGSKPTEAEFNQIVGALPAGQAAQIGQTQANYESAMSAIGARPSTPFKKEGQASFGGGGGGGGGGGASSAGGGGGTVGGQSSFGGGFGSRLGQGIGKKLSSSSRLGAGRGLSVRLSSSGGSRTGSSGGRLSFKKASVRIPRIRRGRKAGSRLTIGGKKRSRLRV